MDCQNIYAPNPNCHTGHPQASSVHDTAFTGGPMVAPIVWFVIILVVGISLLALSRAFRKLQRA